MKNLQHYGITDEQNKEVEQLSINPLTSSYIDLRIAGADHHDALNVVLNYNYHEAKNIALQMDYASRVKKAQILDSVL